MEEYVKKPDKSKAISRCFLLICRFNIIWSIWIHVRFGKTEWFALNISFGMTVSDIHYLAGGNHPFGIQPHLYSSYELSSGRFGSKSYICNIHLCSLWGTGQPTQSIPLNRSSEFWSCRKVTQVNDQIMFGHHMVPLGSEGWTQL